MSIFSSLFKVVKKVISKVISTLKKIFKKIWPLLLIVAIIYFAPAIAGFFTSAGFTGIGGIFSSIATNITPALTSFLSSAWSGIGSVASSAWAGFQSLGMGTQLAVVSGAAALIAPEETAQLVTEIGTTVGDTAGTIIGAVGKALPGWIWIGLGGLAVWALWPASDEKEA